VIKQTPRESKSHCSPNKRPSWSFSLKFQEFHHIRGLIFQNKENPEVHNNWVGENGLEKRNTQIDIKPDIATSEKEINQI
jgi:hypothetical protein